MSRSLWTRKVLAIPVCTAIVMGGVAFGATAAMADTSTPPATSQTTAAVTPSPSASASAPASTFTLTSPKNGSTVPSRSVEFTGTGTPGDLVNLLDAAGNRVGPQVQVDTDGTWQTVGVFSQSASTTQELTVDQVGGGQGQGTVQFTITLPAPVATSTPLTVTTPTNGSTVASRTVTFTGKGTPGDAVAIVNRTGQDVAPATVVAADGTWTTTATFASTAAAQQALVVGEVDKTLTVVGTVDLTITLPAVVVTPGTPVVGTLPVVSG